MLTQTSFGEPPPQHRPGWIRRTLHRLLPRVPLDTDLWEDGDQPSQLDQWDRRRTTGRRGDERPYDWAEDGL